MLDRILSNYANKQLTLLDSLTRLNKGKEVDHRQSSLKIMLNTGKDNYTGATKATKGSRQL